MSLRVLGILSFAGLMSAPNVAAACMIEPLPYAKIFDEPPKEVDDNTRVARFEVLEIGEGETKVRLIEPLFGLRAGSEVRFKSDWDSCTLKSEVWGEDYGAVTKFRDAEGNIQLFLRSFGYQNEGPFFWRKRVPIGPMRSMPPWTKAHLSG